MKVIPSLCGLLAGGLLLGGLAEADSLPANDVWYTQYDLMQTSGEFFANTYTAPSHELVRITGYYDNTDQYDVYVNGTLKLTTPAMAGPAVDYGDKYGTYTTPGQAVESNLFSEGMIVVNAADVISIREIGPLYLDAAATQTYGMNEYDAQVGVQAIPEPAGIEVTLAGLGVLLIWRRRSVTPKERRAL